jgi:NitT/TauT family transport system substrate-binding protein
VLIDRQIVAHRRPRHLSLKDRPVKKLLLVILALAGLAHAGPARAADKLTVLTGPVLLYDAVWMADVKGFYKAENLDVEFRLFPTGATALQTFKTGQGDIVFTGDLPALTYWAHNDHDYQMISLLERDSKGYTLMAQKAIAKPADLAGKTVATRVGANGSFFIAQYFKKNGLQPGDIKVKNLDAQYLPSALCQGDIDAFFIWQPFGQRALETCPDKVHELSTAEGYFRGNTIAGARPAWLATPKGADAAIRFLRATAKGKAAAEADFADVAAYAKAKYGIEPEAARFQWAINERVHTYDQEFENDLCMMNGWMVSEKIISAPVDLRAFTWMDGVRALGSPKLVKGPIVCTP